MFNIFSCHSLFHLEEKQKNAFQLHVSKFNNVKVERHGELMERHTTYTKNFLTNGQSS